MTEGIVTICAGSSSCFLGLTDFSCSIESPKWSVPCQHSRRITGYTFYSASEGGDCTKDKCVDCGAEVNTKIDRWI